MRPEEGFAGGLFVDGRGLQLSLFVTVTNKTKICLDSTIVTIDTQ